MRRQMCPLSWFGWMAQVVAASFPTVDKRHLPSWGFGAGKYSACMPRIGASVISVKFGTRDKAKRRTRTQKTF